jgi:hypothetical protein
MGILDWIIFLCLGILSIPVLLIALGVIIYSIVTFYLTAFRLNLWWGLLILFFPLALPVFIFLYWNKVKKPVLTFVGGLLLLLLAGVLLGGG